MLKLLIKELIPILPDTRAKKYGHTRKNLAKNHSQIPKPLIFKRRRPTAGNAFFRAP
jgi:hypothetical protein